MGSQCNICRTDDQLERRRPEAIGREAVVAPPSQEAIATSMDQLGERPAATAARSIDKSGEHTNPSMVTDVPRIKLPTSIGN